MSPEIIDAIRAHAQASYPRESCGIVVVRKGRERYMPCRNIAPDNDHFAIHPQDYASAADEGHVVCIVHSHPNTSPAPSEADRVSCEASGVKWLIVAWPGGHFYEFEPTGYKAPLIGREFAYGVLDCYSLIQDYYRTTLDITLPNFDHPDHFWLNGGDLYTENFSKAGFVEVQDIQKHDVLLMQIAADVPNHGAVYIGDGLIIQHCMNRLSSRDVYGGYWQKCTVKILRHKDVPCAK